MNTPTYHELTRYGPGKFDLQIDTLAYEAIMHGVNDSCGDVDTIGEHISFVSMLPGHYHYNIEKLSITDVTFLNAQRAAIVSEDSQGFVRVEWFEDADAARKKFDAIAAEIDALAEPEDCDEPEEPNDERSAV